MVVAPALGSELRTALHASLELCVGFRFQWYVIERKRDFPRTNRCAANFGKEMCSRSRKKVISSRSSRSSSFIFSATMAPIHASGGTVVSCSAQCQRHNVHVTIQTRNPNVTPNTLQYIMENISVSSQPQVPLLAFEVLCVSPRPVYIPRRRRKSTYAFQEYPAKEA